MNEQELENLSARLSLAVKQHRLLATARTLIDIPIPTGKTGAVSAWRSESGSRSVWEWMWVSRWWWPSGWGSRSASLWQWACRWALESAYAWGEE